MELTQEKLNLPSDLDEAAKEYLDEVFGEGEHYPFYIKLFKAGAKWMFNKMIEKK